MTIKFSQDVCRAVLEKAGVALLPRAPAVLARILNREVSIWIAQIEGAPIPKTGDTRANAASIMGRVTKVIESLGCSAPLSGDVAISETHSWPQAIKQINDLKSGKGEEKIDVRLRRIVEDLNWLQGELFQLQLHLVGYPSASRSSNDSNTRKAATRMLVAALVRSAKRLFKEPLTVSDNTGRRGGEVGGPALVFLAEALSLMQDRLREGGKTNLATDPALKISRSTLAKWFYEFRDNTMT